MDRSLQEISIEDCLKEVNKIRDKEVKGFVFHNDWDDIDFLRGATDIYPYFNNIVIITFMYLYGKYLSWKKYSPNALKERPELTKSSNFMRIVTSFEKLYSSFNLSYELIENILADIQILLNTANNSIYTKELGIEGDFATINDFSSCLVICRKGRTSLRQQRSNAGILRKKLVDFLTMVPFLTGIDIEGSPFDYEGEPLKVLSSNNDREINLKKLCVKKLNKIDDNREIDTSYVFLYDEKNEQYYYLSSVEDKEAKNEFNETVHYLILTYNTVGIFEDETSNDAKLYIVIKQKDKGACELEISDYFYMNIPVDPRSFREVFFGIKEKNAVSHFIRDFNSINFRYIRILSLAISDILDEESKRMIYETYSVNPAYKSMFVKNSDDVDDLLNNDGLEEIGYGWDVVVAVILIGESAKKFLFVLFDGHSNRFEELLINLEYRFGKEIINKDVTIKECKEKLANAKSFNFKEAYGDFDRVKNIRKKGVNDVHIEAKIQASVVVSELSRITYSNQSEDKKMVFPLSIVSRRKIIQELSNIDVGDESDRVQAIKNLVCQTLKTLYVFYRGFFEYGARKLNFERLSLVTIFKQDEIEAKSKDAIDAFKAEIKIAAEELSHIKDDDVRAMALKLKEFNKNCSYPGKQNSYSEILHQLLGREYLIQYRGIASLENCFDRYENERDFYDLTGAVRKAMDYLSTGELDNRSRGVRNVIFPFVVYLDYTSKTRDGYDIYHCSLSNTGDLDYEADYRVISEFNYPVNVSYYCIPNIARSNDEMRLWIEPIMIDSNLLQEVDFSHKEQ